MGVGGEGRRYTAADPSAGTILRTYVFLRLKIVGLTQFPLPEKGTGSNFSAVAELDNDERTQIKVLRPKSKNAIW